MTPRTRTLRNYVNAPSDRAATDVLIDGVLNGSIASSPGEGGEPPVRRDGPSREALFRAYDFLTRYNAKTDQERTAMDDAIDDMAEEEAA